MVDRRPLRCWTASLLDLILALFVQKQSHFLLSSWQFEKKMLILQAKKCVACSFGTRYYANKLEEEILCVDY